MRHDSTDVFRSAVEVTIALLVVGRGHAEVVGQHVARRAVDLRLTRVGVVVRAREVGGAHAERAVEPVGERPGEATRQALTPWRSRVADET
jgi:hypothetical protein